MRTLLVVDDEKFIRQGICAIINRSGKFDIILEAKNGKEALDIIESRNVDIMVTDIRMPILDGIGLIKSLKEKENKPKTVILSGYDEFNYAKEALNCGAKSYLLKPVDRKELLDVIDNLEKEIILEEQKENNHKGMANYISQVTENELNFIFLNEDIKEDEVERIVSNLNLNIFDKPFYLSIFMSKNGENDDLFFITYLEEYLKGKEFLCIQNTKGQYVLITRELPSISLIGEINRNFDNKYIQAVSGLVEKNLRVAYEQAVLALNYRVLIEGDIIQYNKTLNRVAQYTIINEDFDKIFNMINAKRPEEAIELLHNIFSGKNYVVRYYEECGELFYKSVIYYFEKSMPDVINRLKTEFNSMDDIYNFRNIRTYLECATQYVRGIVNNKDCTVAENINNKEIDIALLYINENYDKDLNLAIVSNYVSLSYSYFSLMFKEKTGLGFTDYLKMVRINKSKELLKNSEFKIYEIAQKVGYENPKQFMKVFRKATGISPSEFREL